MYMFFILVTLAMHFIVHKIKVCSKFLEKIGSCVIINLHTNVGYIITTNTVTKLSFMTMHHVTLFIPFISKFVKT